MEIEKLKAIIEAILFAAGRDVKINEFITALEIGKDEVIDIIENLRNDYKESSRGIEIIKVNDGYQMCTKRTTMNTYTQFLIKEISQNFQMLHWKHLQ